MDDRRRRDGRFGKPIKVCLTPATIKRVQYQAGRFGLAVGTLLRDAIERGLSLAVDSRRKAARDERDDQLPHICRPDRRRDGDDGHDGAPVSDGPRGPH